MDRRELTALVDTRRQDDQWKNSFYYTRVSPTHQYLWGSVQKVASVTIAIALRQLDGIPFTDGSLWDDDEVPKLTDFTTSEITEILTSPHWFRFCFVRNPYTRVFSAYKDKIGRMPVESHYMQVQDEIREMFNYPIRDGQRAGRVAFRDFVGYVQAGGRPNDNHWSMQSRKLMLDMISYDFIGRFETFAADVEVVLDRLNAPDEVRTTALTRRGQSSEVHLSTAYDRELARSLYDLYRDDFEVFGYQPDSWMLDDQDA